MQNSFLKSRYTFCDNNDVILEFATRDLRKVLMPRLTDAFYHHSCQIYEKEKQYLEFLHDKN